MKRLLVTGATGFIGAHCLREIEAGPYDEIHAVGRVIGASSTSRTIWYAADLRQPAAATAIVEAVRPTHLFHAAWIATPGAYVSSPENIDWLQSTIALVRAFAEGGGQRFVGVGSSAEYGPSDEACAEDRTPIAPLSLYGKAKHTAWCAIQAIAQHHKMETAWGRVFLPYGPGDAPARLIPMAIAALRAHKPLPLTHGRQERDFVYAPDAGWLLARLLAAPAIGAFNIASGERRSVRTVLEAIAERLQASDCLRFGEVPLRAEETPVLIADMRKAREQLGFPGPTLFAEAIERTIASVRSAIPTQNF